MQVIVNGEAVETQEDQSLAGLIDGLKLDPKVLVVELNGKIVARDEYSTRILEAGDKLELVRLVGGG
jgi:sulfur carrier protein